MTAFALLAVPLVVLAMTSSVRLRLSIAAFLAVPQFYVPGLPQSTGVFKIWVLLIGVAALVDLRRRPTPIERLLACLAVACALASLWSPQPQAAFFAVMNILCVLIISLYARTIQTTDSRGLSTVTSILAGWIILESILVIGFRLFPSIEDRFYRSPLGDVFVGSQRLDGYFGLFPDNATAFNKAGGFWLNANTASMFLGAAAWALVWAYVLWRRKIVAYGAAMAFFAVPFTGSKTGLVLLVATVFFVVALRWLLARYGGAGVAVLALTALPLYIFVTHLVELLPSTFRSDSSESLGSRGLIWSVARDLFHQYPAQGLGFGGWTNEFASRIGGLLAARLPPHNTFIAYWANTGLLGASLLFGLWIAIAVTCVRMVKRSRWSRWASAAVCASLGWIAIHGMGDAVDFYGDERSMLLFGLLLGVIVVGSSPREDVEDLGLASNATSGYARPDVPTNRVRSRPELGRVP